MNSSTNLTEVQLQNTTNAVSLSKAAIISWMSVYLSMSYTGAFSNLLVITLIIYDRRLNTGCGRLIAHCLLAHIIICSVLFPVDAVTVYQKHILRRNDFSYCDAFVWMRLTCRFAANWIETCIAANRVAAMLFPYKYREFAQKRRENYVVMVVWIATAVLASLGWFQIGVRYGFSPVGLCTNFVKDAVGFWIYFFGYYVPVAAAFVGYGLIYGRMLMRTRQRNTLVGDAEGTGASFNKKRLLKVNMVFLAFFANTVCTLMVPLFIALDRALFNRLPLLYLWLQPEQVFGYFIGTLIFFAMNADYRSALRRLCQLVTCHRSTAVTVAPTHHAATNRPQL